MHALRAHAPMQWCTWGMSCVCAFVHVPRTHSCACACTLRSGVRPGAPWSRKQSSGGRPDEPVAAAAARADTGSSSRVWSSLSSRPVWPQSRAKKTKTRKAQPRRRSLRPHCSSRGVGLACIWAALLLTELAPGCFAVGWSPILCSGGRPGAPWLRRTGTASAHWLWFCS